MRTAVIIGGGRFGTTAAIEARMRGDRALVVDRDPGCMARGIAKEASDPDAVLRAGRGEVLFRQGDGAAALLDLMERWVPDLVVPAAPGHLAALLAVERGRRAARPLAPAPELAALVRERLPPRSVALIDEANAVVVTSFMGEGRCVDGCAQDALCPVTGERHDRPMHELIRTALEGAADRSVVLISSATGTVGGLAGGDLGEMLRTVDRTGDGEAVAIATACRCHGVINLLRRGKEGQPSAR